MASEPPRRLESDFLREMHTDTTREQVDIIELRIGNTALWPNNSNTQIKILMKIFI